MACNPRGSGQPADISRTRESTGRLGIAWFHPIRTDFQRRPSYPSRQGHHTAGALRGAIRLLPRAQPEDEPVTDAEDIQHLLRDIQLAFIFAMTLTWCTIQFRSRKTQQHPTADRTAACNAFGGCVVKAAKLRPHSKPKQDQKCDDLDFGSGVDR